MVYSYSPIIGSYNDYYKAFEIILLQHITMGRFKLYDLIKHIVLFVSIIDMCVYTIVTLAV